MLPLHPRVVHLPIALSVLMPLVTSGLLVAWWRGWLPRRAWVVAVALQAVLVAGAVFALRTGEADERQAETVVPERRIEAHEESAQILTGGAVVVLLLAGAGLLLRGETPARAAAVAAVAGSLLVSFLAWRTGDAGGRLVYEHGAASAFRRAPGSVPVPARAEERE